MVGAAFSKAAMHRGRSLLGGLFYFDAAPNTLMREIDMCIREISEADIKQVVDHVFQHLPFDVQFMMYQVTKTRKEQ